MSVAARSAKAETLVEPSIMGPTAPAGTASPWEIQRASMVVRKMAGKMLTIPAMTGPDTVASATARPMALAASRPRPRRVTVPTCRVPAGAGPFRRQATVAKAAAARKKPQPQRGMGRLASRYPSVALRSRNAMRPHALMEAATMVSRRARKDQPGSRGGITRQDQRNSAFTIIPAGTT
jgi:hypothetical protein